MIWRRADIAEPDIPSPIAYDWQEKDCVLTPVRMTSVPAPESVLNLVCCGCDVNKSACSTGTCSCRRAVLVCTELCKCNGDVDECENTT